MNGAQSLVQTLVRSGVRVCFANPGTSEMHFVAALDGVHGGTAPPIRPVLGLFEGAVTGAADGYARMTGHPAAVLLHLGPGLGNGLANLHNARRANTPMVAIVGDHATTHRKYDAPLQSDIPALAGWLQGWCRRSETTADVGADGAAAVAAALDPPGRIATLILPADVSWGEGGQPADPVAVRAASPVSDDAVDEAAVALRSGEPCVLLLGGAGCGDVGIRTAGRIATATGVQLNSEPWPARARRGSDVPAAPRLAYLAKDVAAQLGGARHLILAGATAPVTFFGYPGESGDLVPEGCQVHVLAAPAEDIVGALAAVLDAVHGGEVAEDRPGRSPGAGPASDADEPLTPRGLARVLGALLPADSIVSEEGITASAIMTQQTQTSAPHEWLTLTGGAIGQGIPVATGAAIACPDRRVVNIQADGSAIYTISGLWTQAREGLDVTTVILNNRSYAILAMELARVGAAPPGPRASSLLDLSGPDLDFCALAAGYGVPGTRAQTVGEFSAAFGRSVAEPGPHLIEAIL